MGHPSVPKRAATGMVMAMITITAMTIIFILSLDSS